MPNNLATICVKLGITEETYRARILLNDGCDAFARGDIATAIRDFKDAKRLAVEPTPGGRNDVDGSLVPCPHVLRTASSWANEERCRKRRQQSVVGVGACRIPRSAGKRRKRTRPRICRAGSQDSGDCAALKRLRRNTSSSDTGHIFRRENMLQKSRRGTGGRTFWRRSN